MNTRQLAPHVLRTLACYQLNGRAANLQTLVDQIRVRRADLRQTVSALHREGFVDAYRMRLTMAGFLLGTALLTGRLPELRPATATSAAA
ncbi:MAG: hypothetical protein FWD57_05020 [Polyangiaceae bacterium]|nr:hypothetical protein [Polyangiaceae bacterium]